MLHLNCFRFMPKIVHAPLEISERRGRSPVYKRGCFTVMLHLNCFRFSRHSRENANWDWGGDKLPLFSSRHLPIALKGVLSHTDVQTAFVFLATFANYPTGSQCTGLNRSAHKSALEPPPTTNCHPDFHSRCILSIFFSTVDPSIFFQLSPSGFNCRPLIFFQFLPWLYTGPAPAPARPGRGRRGPRRARGEKSL